MNVIKDVNRWHSVARPEPEPRDLTIQFACMLEEVIECLDSVQLSRRGSYAHKALSDWMTALKTSNDTVLIKDRKGLCDGLADVIVTAVGVGHCAKMDIPKALDIVNASNFSKFCADGTPLRNDQGKIVKNPLTYNPPVLDGCY